MKAAENWKYFSCILVYEFILENWTEQFMKENWKIRYDKTCIGLRNASAFVCLCLQKQNQNQTNKIINK